MTDRTVSRSMTRWAGAAGIGFAVLLFNGFAIASGAPSYDESDEMWVSWFQDSGNRAAQVVAMFLVAAAALLLILFFAILLQRAHAAGGNPTAVVIAGIAGTSLATSVAIAGVIRSSVSAAVTFAPNYSVPSADILRTIDNLAIGMLFVAGGFSAALFIASFAYAVRGTSLIPNWLSVAGYVVGVLLLASFAFFPFILLPLWMLVAGIAVVARRESPERVRSGTT